MVSPRIDRLLDEPLAGTTEPERRGAHGKALAARHVAEVPRPLAT